MLFRANFLYILLSVFTLFYRSNAVFSEDINTREFHKSGLGSNIKHIFPYNEKDSEFIFISEDSILSYVDASSGEVLLRQVLDNKYTHYKLLNDSRSLGLYESKHNNLAKVLDLNTGIYSENVEAFHDLPSKELDFKRNDVAFHFNQEDLSITLDTKVQKSLKYSFDEKHFLVEKNMDLEIKYIDVNEKGTLLKVLIFDKYNNIYYKFDVNLTTRRLLNKWNLDNVSSNISHYTILEPIFVDIDFPEDFTIAPSDTTNVQQLLHNYIERVKFSVNAVRNYVFVEKKIKWATFILDVFSENKSEEAVQQRNRSFGFNKYLVAINEDNMVFGIDMNTGLTLWRFKIANKDAVIKGVVSDSNNVIEFIDEYGMVYKYTINDFTADGFDFEVELLPLKYFKGSKITGTRQLSTQSLLIQFSNDQDFVYFVNDIFEEKFSSDVVIKTLESKIVSQDIKNLKTIWTYDVDIDRYNLIKVTGKQLNDKVANVAITDVEKTLFKYINHNMIAVVLQDKQSDLLIVDILDSETGSIIQTVDIEDSKVDFESTIDVLFTENTLLVSYKSLDPVPEQKISVIELFENLETKEINFNVVSYIYPEVIVQMALTNTKYGVSVKNILFKLENGQVTMVPKTLLSTIRKNEKEMSDKEKMFIQPYYQVIPVNDHYVLTNTRQLLKPKNASDVELFSIDTNVESTTFVLDIEKYDIFINKIPTSNEFDILQENYQKYPILITVLIVLIALNFIQPMIKKRQLKLKYYIN